MTIPAQPLFDVTKPLATASEFAAHLRIKKPKLIRTELEKARKLGAAVQLGSGKRREWRVNLDLYWKLLAEKP